MKWLRLITGAVLGVLACAAISAHAQRGGKKAPPPKIGSLVIVNKAPTDVRVRLIGYELASREPIDIPAGYSRTLPRIAAGDYVLVVHCKKTRKALLCPTEPITVRARRPGSDEQTTITLSRKEDGKYAVKTS